MGEKMGEHDGRDKHQPRDGRDEHQPRDSRDGSQPYDAWGDCVDDSQNEAKKKPDKKEPQTDRPLDDAEEEFARQTLPTAQPGSDTAAAIERLAELASDKPGDGVTQAERNAAIARLAELASDKPGDGIAVAEARVRAQQAENEFQQAKAIQGGQEKRERGRAAAKARVRHQPDGQALLTAAKAMVRAEQAAKEAPDGKAAIARLAELASDKPGDGITQPPDAEAENLMERAARRAREAEEARHDGPDAEAFDIDAQIAKAEASHNPPLVAALQHLKDRGIDKDVVLSLGSSFQGPEQRWWQCPHCKAYLDAMVSVHGDPERLVFEDLLRCPNLIDDPKDPDGARKIVCNTAGSEFDTVEGEYFDLRFPKLKARVQEGLHEAVVKSIRAARAAIAGSGLFQADPQFDKEEPRWPREMAAVILGVGAYLGEMIHKQTTAVLRLGEGSFGQRKHRPKQHKARERNPGHPPTAGEGSGFGHEGDD